ncbi:MAG: bifunctional 5,10-methylenetetrahydrofolate dehydrogenase/5,10-methenyltetrahydrofolate cyclohydrolase [Patescibacteria group bacterium]|nr:bifunctional 5,10-methylenetetrahydrofolate dehydrogenase/5,10-methenyltetrahydrofolate cyclohydrolase [Patescibacteria group bacterium]
MIIIDGKKIKDEILAEVKERVLKLPFTPVFCDILVGDNPVSASYVRIKSRLAEQVGIKFRTVNFTDKITTDELIAEIENLNRVPHMRGIIIQLPLPDHINKNQVLDAIRPELDVDCLGSKASEDFYNNVPNSLCYPTGLACLELLNSLHIDLSDKNIVVSGQGTLVGKPVTHLLRSRGLTVATIDSQTENKNEILKNADVIISAIGKGKYLTGEMIKKDVIIIDAGTSESTSGIVGDVDLESVKDIASYVSPVPGGVGPVTVAMLLNNVLKVSEML